MNSHFAQHSGSLFRLKPLKAALLHHFCLLGLCLASAQSFANQDAANHVLPEQKVISTAVSEDATQPSAQTFAENIQSIPGGVSLVESNTFDTKHVSTFADSLGYATGVFIQPRFGSEESRLSIRGSGLQRTFHGRGTRLMQDGIPINLADGGFDFQAIEPLASQYVQVYRGANAFGLGASTLGGAIDYISETGQTASPLGARMEVGSFAYHRATAHIAKQEENWDGYFFVSDHRQEGFREYARQDGNKWVGNLGLKLNSQLATRFYVGGARSNSQLPGNLSLAQIAQNASQANAVSRAGAYRRDVNLDRLANKTVYQYAGGSVEFNVYASLKDLYHPIFQVIDQNSKDWGGQVKWNTEHQFMGKASNTRVGLGYSKGITDNLNRNNVAGQPGTTTFDDSQQVALQQDFFIENQTQWTEHISGVIGLQYTQAERKYSGFNSTAPASIGGPNLFFERSYDDMTPRLGVIVDRSTDAQWYGNFSGAFEPPSFGELGAGGAAGALNINNQAQKANSFEVGYRSTKPLIANGLHWDVAAYIMNIRDELMATIDPVTSLASTFNVDKTQRSGFELGMSYIQGPWTVRSSTLLNRFKFENDRDFGNNTIAGAPSFASRLLLERRINMNLTLGASLEGASKTWVDHLNTVQAPGYGIVNVHAHGQLVKGVHWFIDARNLGDKTYVATTGVVRQYNPAAPQQFLPGDGRSVYAGLRWNFE